MPTYTYRCQNCGYEFTKVQPITSGALKKCPWCMAKTLVRLIEGGSTVIFKGPGFYCNDYRSNSKKG